ncbi:MAG: hypothetical protein IPQ22_16980 [Rhodoferax sp.]|nr:hypothetical protein [Rhodoferax sp.]
MSDLHEARVEAGMRACVLSPEIPTGQRAHLIHPEGVLTIRERVDLDVVVEKILAAADAVVTVDGLQERIEDTLAYYQCRETNPKADHPSMGYHAFSEEQREFLRARKSEAAAEIVRMILTLLRGGEER